MKLYATTTSERASKGQGGNDYIEIEVKDEEKVIAHIRAIPDFTNTRLFIRVYDRVDFEKTFYIPTVSKGKQKTYTFTETQERGTGYEYERADNGNWKEVKDNTKGKQNLTSLDRLANMTFDVKQIAKGKQKKDEIEEAYQKAFRRVNADEV